VTQAFVDTLLSALRTLSANKLRSALTLLGIVIGVVTVVLMAATTAGLRNQIDKDLSQLGAGVFQIQKWPNDFGPRNPAKYEKRKNFTLGDVVFLQTRCVSCLHVAGEVWDNGKSVAAGDKTKQGVRIAGGTVEFFGNNGFALASGRLFTDADISSGAPVAVVGSDVAEYLFPGLSPIGESIRIGNLSYRIVGVLERRGASMDFSIDNIVALPITKFLLAFGTKQSLNITIAAREPDRIGVAQDEVVALMRKARGVAPEAENDFEMFSNRSMQERFDQMTGAIAAGSIGICAISLLIGGIGVMNIMLVAVTERTSEIGVRRALGARRRRILAQFVSEAVMLTSVGGALGVLLGMSGSWLIKVLVDLPATVPMWAILASMLCAGGTGLLFGIYPAYRASRLDPVEAMRHE
jgi:putative ABC transport system permease protein